MTQSVSVAIPTLNAAGRIGALLEKLEKQTVSPLEILVIDSSSEDGTADEVKKFPDVKLKVIDRKNFNHGLTRHDALMKASGDLVCFLTDDAVPANENFIANLIKPLEDEQVGMSYGRQLPRHDARLFERIVREKSYSKESNVRSKEDIPKYGIKTFNATDVCSCYRRSAYLECGGFGKVNTNEDMLMAAKLIYGGYKVAYAADAEVIHSHNFTFKQQYKRNKQIGYFLEKHAEELGNMSEIGEGKKLVLSVLKELCKTGHMIEAGNFCIDCCARFAGNRAGRKKVRNK